MNALTHQSAFATESRSLGESARRIYSSTMYVLCAVFAGLILLILALVLGYLLTLGFTHISLDVFTKLPIPPGVAGYPGGMKNGFIGTAILIGLASLVGIPMGMLCGVFLSEYSAGSYLAAPVRFVADVLTGVPSIVVGILGYELLVVPLGDFNGWAGALALAFIMVPIVARTTEEMLLLVPNSYREASTALGATKARTILKVVIPAATGSIITGIMLAIARVAGETAPLLFTALGSAYVETNPRHWFPSLTKQIYDFASGYLDAQKKMAWAGILVLISLIFVLNLGIRFTMRKFQTQK